MNIADVAKRVHYLENLVKEQEENINGIMQINARLRDEKREAFAEWTVSGWKRAANGMVEKVILTVCGFKSRTRAQ